MINSQDETAKVALSNQISALSNLYDKGIGNPEFTAWRNQTRELLKRYLPDSPLTSRFDHICFDKPEFASSDMSIRGDFINGLDAAKEYLEEAIEYIQDFGTHRVEVL